MKYQSTMLPFFNFFCKVKEYQGEGYIRFIVSEFLFLLNLGVLFKKYRDAFLSVKCLLLYNNIKQNLLIK